MLMVCGVHCDQKRRRSESWVCSVPRSRRPAGGEGRPTAGEEGGEASTSNLVHALTLSHSCMLCGICLLMDSLYGFGLCTSRLFLLVYKHRLTEITTSDIWYCSWHSSYLSKCWILAIPWRSETTLSSAGCWCDIIVEGSCKGPWQCLVARIWIVSRA